MADWIPTRSMIESMELQGFPNLGRKSAEMLADAGITTIDQLRDLGPLVAFLAVRQCGHQPSLNLLWAMAAGLQNRHWNELSEQEKRSLRNQLEDLTA